MALSAQEVFAENVRALPPSERLRLAALILQDLAQSEVAIVLLVPKLRLGNRGREARASRLLDQTRITSIKPSCPASFRGTGIPPMLRLVDIAAFDRVVVDIIQFHASITCGGPPSSHTFQQMREAGASRPGSQAGAWERVSAFL